MLSSMRFCAIFFYYTVIYVYGLKKQLPMFMYLSPFHLLKYKNIQIQNYKLQYITSSFSFFILLTSHHLSIFTTVDRAWLFLNFNASSIFPLQLHLMWNGTAARGYKSNCTTPHLFHHLALPRCHLKKKLYAWFKSFENKIFKENNLEIFFRL